MDESKSPDTHYLYVGHTGWVMDDIPIHVISSCNMDIYTFPFDIQNCTFTFNSYQLTGKLARLKDALLVITPNFIIPLYLIGLAFSTAVNLQLFFAEPVEVTLHNSLSVMKTKGEWELVDMHAEKPPIIPEELTVTIDALIYHV